MDQTQRNDMTGYVDVNEAYYNDLIMESFQPMFGWTLLDPMILQLCPHGACFRTLCFGFRSAPYYFTRKLRLPLEWIRAWGVRLADVMDDILVLAAQLSNELPEANALRQLMVLLITLDFLGVPYPTRQEGILPQCESTVRRGVHLHDPDVDRCDPQKPHQACQQGAAEAGRGDLQSNEQLPCAGVTTRAALDREHPTA